MLKLFEFNDQKKKYRPDVKHYRALPFYTKPTRAKNI